MNDLFTFIDNHQVLSVAVFTVVVHYGSRLLRMPFRCLNIWIRGWPPTWVDADGDAVQPDVEM